MENRLMWVMVVSALLAPWLLAGQARAAAPQVSSHSAVSGPGNGLSDLALVSSTEGWAVGYAEPCATSRARSCVPLLRHYLNGTWSSVPLPFPGWLTTISLLSARDGWAGGYDGLLLHYDGVTWQQVTTQQNLSFLQLQMLSDTDGWAIGFSDASPGSSIWRYNGHTWTPQAPLSGLSLGRQYKLTAQALAMVSPTEGWVTGALIQQVQDGAPATAPRVNGGAVILHYTAGHWNSSTRIPNGNLTTISMASAADGWAMGNTEGTRPATPTPSVQQTPLLLHYTQGRWKQVANPVPNPTVCCLSTVTMCSASDGWAAGPESGIEPRPIATMLHYTGRQWQVVRVPLLTQTRVTITRIAMTSPTEGWAVGSLTRWGTPDSTTPLILRYQHGAWNLFSH